MQHYRKITPLQFNNLLQLCCRCRALNPARQTHQQIIVHGLDQNPFIATKLIQIYADFGDTGSAWTLFVKLPQPNVFAFTSVLSCHLRKGDFDSCLSSYNDMKLVGVLPDCFVFPKVVRACAVIKCLGTGEGVHKDVIVWGAARNVEVCNSLIDMYSKCEDVGKAKRVFNEMEDRDLLSWNMMISGYVCNEVLDFPAEEMLGCMRMQGLEPDIVTWNMIMDSYCRMGRCDEARDVFRRIEEPDVISWTTLISGYSRVGEHEVSLGIFTEMMKRRGSYADVDCVSSVLASCQQMGALRCGREVHGYGVKMDRTGREFYKSAGPALLAMYAKCRRTIEARHVFRMMDKSDVVAWNAMILGYAELGMGTLAMECFTEMQNLGVNGDQTTISTLLPACDLESGKQPLRPCK